MKKLFTLFLLSILSVITHAQTTLEITVIGANTNQAVANIPVTISNQSLNFTSDKTTDAQGKIRLTDITPTGTYQAISAGNEEYAPASSGFVTLRPDRVNRITLYLPKKSGATLTEVEVTGSTITKINTSDAQVISRISRKEIEALPIEGRDVTRSLYRLPNLTISTLGYAEAPNVAINGLNGIYTNYLIDGMDNNERFLGNVKFNTPFGFTQGIMVLTNNYSSEFGNTSNGIVNVTTRSGSNDFTGEVFYLTRPGSVIDSKSAFATLDLSGNQVKDGFQRHQVGVGLGGPIVKDKTYFYFNFERTFDKKDNLLNVPILGVNETVTGRNNFSYGSLKLDQYWRPNVHSSLRVNIGSFDIERQGGGLEGGVLFPSAGAKQANRTYLIALKNDYDLLPGLRAETNYQISRFRWNYRVPDNPESPSVNVQDPAGQLIATLGYSGSIFDDIENTQQVQQKFLFNKGKHNFKVGVDFITSDFALLGGGNPNGAYTVRLMQAEIDQVKAKNLGSALDVRDIPATAQVRSYDVELNTSYFGARQNVYNIYAEDQFALLSNLKLNLGLRYDYDNLSKGGGDKGDWNNLAPRTSFNYELNERNVIRGGYGIFYDKIKYSVYSDNLQFSSNSPDFFKQLKELQRQGILNPKADLEQITFPGNLLASFPSGVTYLNGPTSDQVQGSRDTKFSNNYRIMNPDGFQNPYSHQYSLGYQRQLDQNKIFYVDLVHTRTNNLFVINNLNSPSAYKLNDPDKVVVRTVAQANATRPIPINGTTATVNGETLRGIARDIFMTETKGKARYAAANFVLQKAKSTDDQFAYRLTYSLSQIKTDTEGINTRALDANDFSEEYAIGDNDRTHVMTGYMTWFPLKDFTITPAFLLQSGQPITRLADAKVYGTTDLNGNGESFGLTSDRQPGEARNSDRLPWATTFDLSLKYQISIKDKPAIEIAADVYNLFNAENLTGYNATRANSNQNQLGLKSAGIFQKRSAAPPRQFQFGLRYIW